MWNLLSDTDTLNRMAGLSAVKFTPLVGAGSARYLASTRLGGFNVTYEEEPYEWVYHESMQVRRIMRTGPVSSLQMTYLLKSIATGGTQVTLRATVTPRSRLLVPFVKLGTELELHRLKRSILQRDGAMARGLAPLPERREAHINEKALRKAMQSLAGASGASGDLLNRLEALVRTADPLQVARIRPLVWGDAWNVPREAALALFLRATQAGLLQMRWDLVCPSCRVAAQSVPSLDEVAQHATCHLCDLKFAVNLEDSCELVFSPHPDVRAPQDRTFCIGGPARTPHVLAQSILPSHGIGTLYAPEAPGRYRLFLRGGPSTTLNVVPGAGDCVRFDSDAISGLATTDLAPKGMVIVNNKDPSGMHAKIERYDWATQAATARDVVGLESFRQAFKVPAFLDGHAPRRA